MDKAQRLRATIHGEPVDRVAVSVWRSFPEAGFDPSALADAHLAYMKDYDWDFLIVTPPSNFMIRDWGAQSAWDGDDAAGHRYVRRVIEAPEDWLALKVLDPAEDLLGEQLGVLDRISSVLGTEHPYVQVLPSPLVQARDLAGDRSLLLHMRQNAGQVHHALQTIADTSIRFIQEARDRGVAGIFYIVQHASYRNMSEAEYQVFGRPYDLQILNALSDLWLNILHAHSPHGMFSMLSDYNMQAVNWDSRDSAPGFGAALKRIKGAVMGGVDRDLLHTGDSDLIVSQARKALAETNGRRLILSTDGMVLPGATKKIMRLLRDSAEKVKAS